MRPSNRLDRLVLPPHLWRLRPFQWLIVDVFDWLFPFCAVNLLWLLCSLTVVLFPSATAALFETGYQAYRGRSPSAKAFLKGVRRWLGPAWLWAAPNVLLITCAVVVARLPATPDLVAAIIAGLVALVLLAQIYFWPYVMLQETPGLRRAVRNSVFTMLGDPVMTGMNLGISLIVAIPSVIIIAPVLFILPVFLVLLYSYSLVGWLDHQGILPGTARDI